MAKIIAGCKHCGHLFKIEELFEGIDVECPKCGEMVVVSKIADRDERGLPVFSEDMDEILDKIYEKADAMEEFANMEQLEEMAETLEVDQGALREAAAARAAVRPPSRKLEAKKPPTKYRVTRPKRSLKKLIVLCFLAAIVIAGGVVAMSMWNKQKQWQKDAKNICARAQGRYDIKDYKGCLEELGKFFPEYEKSEIAKEAIKLRDFATTENGAKNLIDEANKLYKENKLGEAIAKLEKLITDFPDSSLHGEAKELNKTWSDQKARKDALASYQRAQNLFAEGKIQEALPILDRLAKGKWAFSGEAKDLADQIKTYEREAQALYEQGTQHLLDQEFKEAKDKFQQVLERYPNSKVAQPAEKAIETAQRQEQEFTQNNYDRHMREGERLEAAGQYKDAAEEYNKALKQKPNDAVALQKFKDADRMARLFENMIPIPQGGFLMGSNGSDPDEKNEHNVLLDEYYISRYPVTNEEYQEFINANRGYPVPYVKAKWAQAYNWDRNARAFPPGKGKHPVVLVSYEDALAYCKWIGKRLPTEAEWEKAARGRNGQMYPWGNEAPSKNRCNFNKIEQGTSAVGSYPAGVSPFELMDTAGNVWEWCADCYDKDFYKDPNHANNPVCTRNTGSRVLRGGSWANSGDVLRCSNRYWAHPKKKHVTIGFRTAYPP